MKKLIATVAVAFFVGLTSFAADIKKVNQKVLAAFEKEFATATSVSWEVIKGEDICHASFVYASEVMEAYYTSEGEMIGIARFLNEERLPLLVSKKIRENYSKFQVKHISEYMSADNTSYIVTLENEKQSMLIRIYTNGNTDVIKKTKKA